MNQAIVGLSISYVALAALLLGIFLLSRTSVWIKFICVFLVTGFYFLTYQSYLGLLGWPTRQDLPAQFQLMASSITEPDERNGDPGSIHIWITDFEDNKPVKRPRAFELPYDLELHASLDKALEQIRQGKIQLGRNLQKVEEAILPPDASRLANRQHKLEFFDLPEVRLPEK